MAGPEEGVVAEFRKQKEVLFTNARLAACNQKYLDSNIYNAVRFLIRRRLYHKKEDYYKGLSIKNIAYENQNFSLTYFIKYRGFMARLQFQTDPKCGFKEPGHMKFFLIEKSLSTQNQENKIEL